MIFLSRRTSFSAAHGQGHGHNYNVDVVISGEPHIKTGMVMNLVDLDQILKEVVEVLDHQHLDSTIPYFKEHTPTVNNIARFCFEQVAKKLPKDVELHKVRIYETDQYWADYYA